MFRAPFSPSLNADINDGDLHSGSLFPVDLHRPNRLPRMSVLASVKFPHLRRPEPVNPPGTTNKIPLLTLKLSSHSLLDCTLKEDTSISPLYTIQTVNMTTTVVRADPWQKSVKTADIKWPKVIPAKGKGKNAQDGVLVQLKGCPWKGGDSFLKQSTSKSGSRKFNLPHYSHSMKWQKQGTVYWCTSSPVKGPIAVFDPPADQLPGRLTLYETLHDKYEISPMLVHQGVSIFLLDYLLVTVILLVTDPQEWMFVQSAFSSTTSTNDPQPNASLQCGKIARGDPATPTKDQLAKILRREPLFPQIRPGMKSVLSFSSHSDEGDDDDDGSRSARTQPRSSFTESSFLPADEMSALQSSAGPLNYDLSSSYSGQTRSPSPSSAGSRPTPTKRNGSPSQAPRDVSRTRAVLFSELNHMAESSSRASFVGPADASLWKRRPSEPVISRAHSVSRPLPRTPDTPSADNHVIRRAQSHSRINENARTRKPWLSSSPPPLPPIPFTPTSPRTFRVGRSLPPTPFDLEMGRSAGGSHAPAASGVQILGKSFDGDENMSSWVQLLASEEQGASDSVLPRPSFDQPPPAYSSIDFSPLHQQQRTRGS